MGDFERRSEQEASERRVREEREAARVAAEREEQDRRAAAERDAADRLRVENIMRRGMVLIEAMLEGRAAIAVSKEDDVTVIRLRMDPTDG